MNVIKKIYFNIIKKYLLLIFLVSFFIYIILKNGLISVNKLEERKTLTEKTIQRSDDNITSKKNKPNDKKIITKPTNNVNINNVAIKIGSSQEVKLNQTIQEVLSAFGNPTRINKYYFETVGKEGIVYNYNGLTLDFIDNRLFSFLISNANISMRITRSPTYFKVGYNIWDYESFVPYSQFLETEYGSPQIKVLSLYILDNNLYTDAFVYIKLNPNGIITESSIRHN